ncbi:MAG: hypothetical protein ACFFB0_13615 [Promethearchaeota archaeon]
MITIRPINKFKTFKYDAAPFFFFIDIFPPEYINEKNPHLLHLIENIKSNPIMPLPMRVDRVFNGEKSILIRPREPISFALTDDKTAVINPAPFLQYGVEKLLYFTEIRSREKFSVHFTLERALRWWNSTKFLYGNLFRLEEDFSAFSRAYLHTIIKAKILEEDLIDAAKNYCQIVADVCRKRMEENSMLIEIKGKQESVNLYKVKDFTYYKKFKKVNETQYHPELIDIEIFDLREKGFSRQEDERIKLGTQMKSKELKYIPLLFYDDLLECMLQNQRRLEDGDTNLLDPSFLLENEIITMKNPKELEVMDSYRYSWWNSFDDLELETIIKAIESTLTEFLLAFKEEFLDTKRI